MHTVTYDEDLTLEEAINIFGYSDCPCCSYCEDLAGDDFKNCHACPGLPIWGNYDEEAEPNAIFCELEGSPYSKTLHDGYDFPKMKKIVKNANIIEDDFYELWKKEKERKK